MSITPLGHSKQYSSELKSSKDDFADAYMKQKIKEIPYIDGIKQKSINSNKMIKESKINTATYNAVHELDSFLTFSRLEKCEWDVNKVLECVETHLHISIDAKVIEKIIKKRRTSPVKQDDSVNGFEKTGDEEMEVSSCKNKKSSPSKTKDSKEIKGCGSKCKKSTPQKTSCKGKGCSSKNSKEIDSCYTSKPVKSKKLSPTNKNECNSNLNKSSNSNESYKIRKIVLSENLIPTMKKEDRTKMKDYWADLLGEEFAENLIKEY